MTKTFECICDHQDFVILNKPAGVSFHSEDEAGFVVQAQAQLGYELFSVHRLDKVTSGLLILAKSSAAANTLSQCFNERRIEKFYLAISNRKPKKKQGWIKGDMGTARRGSYKLLHTHDNPAITQFISMGLREKERLFLIKPHTGKTHQIRVALKSLGSPIAGDMRYGAAEEAKCEERTYLHAYALRFSYEDEHYSFVFPPVGSERFESAEFKEALVRWQKPWELFS